MAGILDLFNNMDENLAFILFLILILLLLATFN
jgi:hypothetical protein